MFDYKRVSIDVMHVMHVMVNLGFMKFMGYPIIPSS